MKTYTITRPHYSINGNTEEMDLCSHLQDDNLLEFKPFFDQFSWSRLHLDSINDCLKALGNKLGIDWTTQLYVMAEDSGWTVYTRQSESTTLDGQETYYNQLAYVADIKKLPDYMFEEEN
jgi:hypothetical protein